MGAGSRDYTDTFEVPKGDGSKNHPFDRAVRRAMRQNTEVSEINSLWYGPELEPEPVDESWLKLFAQDAREKGL